ncbi:MAG: phage tail tape measure protein, partial [Candidatus Dojkabacteria bacterium]|nr:phage tail tape measure protein [Candidatus Dojkabacteria bacterium]
MSNSFDFLINIRVVNNFSNELSRLQNNLNGLQNNISNTNNSLGNLSNTLANIANITAFTTAFKGITDSYMSLEDAQIKLKSSFMEAGDSALELDNRIQAISDKAIELGNKLPGNTADFYQMASAMKQLGLESETIAKGGLEAAANLAVVLNISYQQAAVSTAKFIDQLGIAKQDAVEFTDVMQRIGHTGVEIKDMSLAFENATGSLKAIGWQGLKASKELAPMIAMLSKLLGGGSTAGTGISNLIGTLANSKQLQEINQELSKFGISLDLLDNKGQFIKDPALMIGQIDKISQALKKGVISESQLISLSSKFFGQGAGADAFLVLAKSGIEGYNQFTNQILKQASLQKRIEVISSSLKNTLESLSGTFSNLLATIGSAIAPVLNSFANSLNNIITKISNFLSSNKQVNSIIAWTITGFATLVTSISAISLAIPIFTHTFGLLKTVFSPLFTVFRTIFTYIPVVIATIKSLSIAFVSNLPIIIASIKSFAVALLTTPIGLAALAIAGAAILIIKFWKPISSFFKGVFLGIKQSIAPTLKPLLDSFLNFTKSIFNSVKTLFPIIIPIFNTVTSSIMSFFKPLDYTGKTAQNWGKIVGQSIGKTLNFIINIASSFFNAGANIINSLTQGIKSVINKPFETMKNVVSKVRNLLPFSPAKEGPLKDIHKIRLVETITESITSNPLIEKFQSILTKVRNLNVTKPISNYTQVLEPMKTTLSPLIQTIKQVVIPAKTS